MIKFELEYNGLKIDGSNIRVNYIDGVGGIPMRTATSRRSFNTGGDVLNQEYDMRNINISGTISTDTPEEFFLLRSRLVSAFGSPGSSRELKITRWDGEVRSIDAYVLNTPKMPLESGNVTRGDWAVSLICPNPFFRSSVAQTSSCSLSIGGGFPVSSTVPMPIGSSVGGVVYITNDGDVADYPSFIIHGLVVNPVVANLTTNESFSISGSYNGDIYIYIDGSGLHVENATSSLMEHLNGGVFKLTTGGNVIKFSCSNYSADARLDIIYYGTYLCL